MSNIATIMLGTIHENSLLVSRRTGSIDRMIINKEFRQSEFIRSISVIPLVHLCPLNPLLH